MFLYGQLAVGLLCLALCASTTVLDKIELDQHPFYTCAQRLKFRLPPAALEDHLNSTIQLTLSLLLSENVNFGSQALVWGENINQTISIPSMRDVCSPDQWEYVKECNEWDRYLDSSSLHPFLPVRRKDDSVVWSSCPFEGTAYEEFLRNTWDGVRVSVVPAQTNSGGPALAWNLTAPCRLEAELWLCRVGGAEQGCREVIGSRQRVEDNRKTEWGWSNGGHWIKGEFLDITPHPSVCVLVKVNGTDRVLGPWCPFSAPVGGAHVLLICPPDVSPSLASKVSRLGSALCKLGFSVTADLWSRAQLGALGPVPWLHAQLSHLEQEGGRAVLILTREALEGAGQSGGRETPKGQAPSPYTDVFATALGCVVADHLQGSTRRRFTLAHFEPLPLGGTLGPLQLSGTRPYSLPAQSLGFLAELTGRRGAGLWLGSRTLDQVLRRQDGGSELKDLGEAVPLKGADTPHTSPQTSTQHCWDAHCM
ncbi:hypothetical protein JZ751_010819 [Albula glossodonta]|uniref:SEFIR domain-containing protein n=1 Tax=Albula glossodonta TaxID=121402 RepID=A0A8T2N0L0_9TELE|nr:hypothetical protein JZ751_010819 [Albula glossodonta]